MKIRFTLSARPQFLEGLDRFFYRVVGKTVWIVAVWHSAQLPSDYPAN